MKIKEKKLRDALNRFFYEMRDRLAKKELEGYTGWDGAYPREKLIAEIKRGVKLCEEGEATQNTALDIANRIFMCWYDFPMGGTKKKSNRIKCKICNDEGVLMFTTEGNPNDTLNIECSCKKSIKAGDKSKAICPVCRIIVTTTFKLSIISVDGIIVKVLKGFCDICGTPVSFPHQNASKIKEAKEDAKLIKRIREDRAMGKVTYKKTGMYETRPIDKETLKMITSSISNMKKGIVGRAYSLKELKEIAKSASKKGKR